MLIQTHRFTLRDFQETDRAAFVAYQMDPRYRALYNFSETDGRRAHELFDLFLKWQQENPRRNFQVGIFDRSLHRLLGCAGLRTADQNFGTAVFGIELAPENWGRYRVALNATSALIDHGFRTLGLQVVVGNTSSGNTRVEKLARWLGANVVGRRAGPDWMTRRGWQEVDWAVRYDDWIQSAKTRAAIPD